MTTPRSASTVAQVILAQLGVERSGHGTGKVPTLQELEVLAREFLRLTRPDQDATLGRSPFLIGDDAVAEYEAVLRIGDAWRAREELTVVLHGARHVGGTSPAGTRGGAHYASRGLAGDCWRGRLPACRGAGGGGGGDVSAVVERVATAAGEIARVVETTTRPNLSGGRRGRAR